MMDTGKLKIEPRWSESKEKIWDEAFAGLDDSPSGQILPFYRKKVFLAVAALFFVLLLIPGYALFYTRTVTVAKGEHVEIRLPDGSKAILNADSRLTYKPYRWPFARDTELQGEAYFEVKKGKRFTVRSQERRVTVRGTSFNVFARPERYSVTCLSGAVQVSDSREEVLLTSGTQAFYREEKLTAGEVPDPVLSVGWMTNHFYFLDVPIEEVLREIERQYDIEIIRPGKNDYIYSGNFARLDNPEDLLHIIGKAFGIQLKIRK